MIIALFWIMLIFTPKAYAQSLTNDNVSIDSYTINLQNNTSSKFSTPAGETAASVSDEAAPFGFSLSAFLVDFGQLSPTNPTTRTTHVAILPGSAQGFTLQIQEEKELMSSNSTLLPDTTCDSGRCNAKSAALWESLLSFGLGYRCDNGKGKGCVDDFQKGSFYKPLANKAKGQLPAIVMETLDNKENDARITYKLNISQTKDTEMYRNVINYIAVPNF